MKKQRKTEIDKLKGLLVTRTAIKTLVPEDIVEKVIGFQFKDMKEVMVEHEQVEISGFGKFMTCAAKIRRRIENLEGALISMEKKIRERPHEITPGRLAVWDKMTQNTQDILAYMKTKKGGYENKH